MPNPEAFEPNEAAERKQSQSIDLASLIAKQDLNFQQHRTSLDVQNTYSARYHQKHLKIVLFDSVSRGKPQKQRSLDLRPRTAKGDCDSTHRTASTNAATSVDNLSVKSRVRQGYKNRIRPKRRNFFKRIHKAEKAKGGGCNCQNSRCLKLYCRCFSGNGFCGPSCKCSNCHNS